MSIFEDIHSNITHIFSWLHSLAGQPSHPGRYPTLITHPPNARTVVIRDVYNEAIVFFTDQRSAKMTELRQHPSCMFHIYLHEERLQLRIYGIASFISSGLKWQEWKTQALKNTRGYSSQHPPGTILTPDYTPQHNTDRAEENLSIVSVQINRIELLQLDTPEHKRLVWQKNEPSQDGPWMPYTLQP